jgi:hypothetical protein
MSTIKCRKFNVKDRSGINKILAAVIVIIIIAAAAVAAYMIMSDDDEEAYESYALGSTLRYDVFIDGEKVDTYEDEFVGLSDTGYLFRSTWNGDEPYYWFSHFYEDVGGEVTDIVEWETMDGIQTVEVWEYSFVEDGVEYWEKTYYCPDNAIVYEREFNGGGQIEIHKLIHYKVDYMPYKESDEIGTTYEYVCKDGHEAKIVCVADGIDGTYGIFYDIIGLKWLVYSLSDNPQGLPLDATDMKETVTLEDTIDGDVSVGLWSYIDPDNVTFTFYCDPDSKVIYRFITNEEGVEHMFDLVKAP